MRKIIAADYNQTLLLPPAIEDWVGADHPVRFIRQFIQLQDLKALGLDTLKREEGGPAFEPALLLGVWLYGYFRKVRSVRMLEMACREEMGFLWLTGNTTPDHNALWRYWNTHRKGIRGLFKQTVSLALKLDLVGFAEQALDGTKIQAACSGYGSYDKEYLEKKIARLDAQTAELEKQIAEAGEQASAQLPEHLQNTQRLKERMQEALRTIESEGRKHVHPSDPEAMSMKTEKGPKFGHNAQAVADGRNNIVVSAELAPEPSDQHQLVPQLEAARQVRQELQEQLSCEEQTQATLRALDVLKNAKPKTKADAGYAVIAQLSGAKHLGHDVMTPPPPSWSDLKDRYHTAHFPYDKSTDTVRCPQGHALHRQATRERAGRQVGIYTNAGACKDCPVRAECAGKKNRKIEVCDWREELEKQVREWQKTEVLEEYRRRAAIIEPVFGQVKQQMGFRRWSYKGREKVRAQWQLLCATWNLKVILRTWKAALSTNSGAGLANLLSLGCPA
jgi:transposase